ncbi:ABC transporter substrate-binding protein [Devosia neptuniae]|jgi:peptide/nickel transport system substrate-binding protein|uniref:ABC transporter substrate-binding protein n=1 Tax=Devosia TaxID=46913 RepID=UPI0022AFDB6A|nr:ABC transporter substrate-binding protein [Devosia neptuniae]MCZ4346681.1 ABC transporter substrate-binding protein [Devosia neptuniae]
MRHDANFGRMRGRNGLRLAGAVALSALLAAAGPALAQQAPELDALVASGDLPPLEERLPANPLVLNADSIGTYGGTWHMGMRGGGDNGLIVKTVAYEGLVRFDQEWKTVVPNLAESWEANEDATEYTFHLRQGVKWSDGTPFTSADIEFAVEIYNDPDYPAGSWIDNVNNPVHLEVIDDYTFKFRFDQPNGMLMDEMASVNGIHITSLQKAYCSQFHPKYNENAAAEAEAKGFSSWALYLQDRCAWGWETIRFSNPDLPTLYAWVIDQPLSANASHVTWDRNPYYWKVDAEGNQLPYMDHLDMRVSESIEELTLLALNGEIDFQERHIATNTNKPLFYDGQEAGDYHLGEIIPSASNTLVLQLNFNHDDPVKRALYQDKNFRIGISEAIDREEIVDVVFTGQGEPFQVAPRPESPFYDEELAKQYTEFNPESAIEHLEAAGLTETNGDGVRLMSDGRPAKITVDVISSLRPEWIDILEIMQLQLSSVGIEIELNNIDRTLFYDKRPGNEFDAQVWAGDGGLEVVQEPRYYFPANDESVWAWRWAQWFNGTRPEIAEEPADWAKEQMELYKQIRSSSDPDQRADLMKQILAITKEQFPVIGVSLMPNGYSIIKNNLGNAPETMFNAWLFPTPSPMDPATWYFK